MTDAELAHNIAACKGLGWKPTTYHSEDSIGVDIWGAPQWPNICGDDATAMRALKELYDRFGLLGFDLTKWLAFTISEIGDTPIARAKYPKLSDILNLAIARACAALGEKP